MFFTVLKRMDGYIITTTHLSFLLRLNASITIVLKFTKLSYALSKYNSLFPTRFYRVLKSTRSKCLKKPYLKFYLGY